MSQVEQLNTLFWHEFAHVFPQNCINFKYSLYPAASHTVWRCLFGTGLSYFDLAHAMHQLSVDPIYHCEKVKGTVTGTPCQISGKEQGCPHGQMESGTLLWLCFGSLVHAHGEAAKSLKQHKAQPCQHNTAPSVHHSYSAVPGMHPHHKNDQKALALNHTNKPRAKILVWSPLLQCMNEAGCWTQASQSWISTRAITSFNWVLPSTSQIKIEMFPNKIYSWQQSIKWLCPSLPCCHTDTMGPDQLHVCELHSSAAPAGHKVHFHGKSTEEPFWCTEHNRDLKKAKDQILLEYQRENKQSHITTVKPWD